MPNAATVAEFLSRFATLLLTSDTPLAGIERALAALCGFVRVDRAAAYIMQRSWPHEIDDYVSVSRSGRSVAQPGVPAAVRSMMLSARDVGGVLLLPETPDGPLGGRGTAGPGSRATPSLRVCRSFIGDDRVAMVAFTSMTSRAWADWELRVIRVASSLIGHGLWRSVLERQLREQRDAFAASEARWRATIDDAPAAIFRVDRDSRILLASREVGRFGDLVPSDLHGLLLRDLIVDDDARQAFDEGLVRVFDLGERAESHVNVHTPHGEVWFDGRGVPEVNEHGTVVSMLLFAVDVTERHHMQRQLAIEATTDSLTGLSNRSMFIEQLERELSEHAQGDRTLAVLFVDLDRFKRTNDAHGHAAGDELLQAVAQRLRASIRAGDVVARLGGDEFAIVLCDVSTRSEVERLVEKLRVEIGRPMEIGGRVVTPSASIGAAISVPTDRDPGDLLRGADHAMYQAKQLGRNRCEVFDEATRVAWRTRLDLEAALREGIDSSAVVVHYLPEVDINTGHVVAVEARARWNHPTRGVLPASEFIALAENSGLIAEIGSCVLRAACEQTVAWGAIDPALLLRVNVSGRELAMTQFVGDIAETLLRSGLEPNRLSIEVSEAAISGDVEAVIDTLRRVRRLGVAVVIDDFGSGHASLSYLERFPIEAVKIDRRFIGGLCENGRDALVVSTLVKLGHALGLDVVAEGVETAEQVSALRALGCRRAQGHFYAPAESAQDMGRRLGVPFVVR